MEMNRKETIALYDRHSRRLYNMSLRIVQDPAEAEEIMQDTVLKFLSRPFRPVGEAQVSAWLARTCIRASIDRLRQKKREALFLEEYASEMTERPYDGGEVSVEEEAGKVLAAMTRLPDHYRLALTLSLVEGLDYGEMAVCTGQKEETLRSLCSRGKKKLIQILKEDGKQV